MSRKGHIMNGRIALDRLDPHKTALVVVHMVKGVAGEVDTPFNRLFRHRAKEKGIIKAQLRLLDGFRRAEAKVVYTAVTYHPGLPGVSPEFPAVAHPLRLSLPDRGHSSSRAHGRPRPPAR